ncbi:selenoprotein S [Elysia marginata]|uniref:Selenoprotein S n=1 Tax=Elysia marginata TaxID=1093978 RepID=A0AAV4JD04_9GAST|nr:selenoprotein S [Elysia marginata]
MAESTEYAEAEDLKNEDPEIVGVAKDTVLGILQQYGWFILIGIALVAYLYNRYRPHLDQWQEQREANSYKKMDEGVAQARMEAMDRARQRMQAQLDEQAKEFAEKQRQKEEEKRQARLEDWDRHQEGKGYRSKTKPVS